MLDVIEQSTALASCPGSVYLFAYVDTPATQRELCHAQPDQPSDDETLQET